jgi:hypothetical protein
MNWVIGAYALSLAALFTYDYLTPQENDVTIEQLLNEVDQHPNVEYEVDAYVFPLFDKMLKEYGYQFTLCLDKKDYVRCKISRTSSSE